MFIETQDTPNPHTMKFIPGVPVLSSGIKSFTNQQEALASPLAQSLLKIEGVVGVFLTQDFITITKKVEHDWSYLKAIALACIVDHFASGMPVYIEQKATSHQGPNTDGELEQRIIELIDTRIRPAVAQDGGDIVFKYYQNGIVYVELHGSCSGCPSATVTLKGGIENMLRHYIPEITAVEAVN